MMDNKNLSKAKSKQMTTFKMRNILCILACLILIFTSFVGCSTANTNVTTTEPSTDSTEVVETTSAETSDDKQSDDFEVTISDDAIKSADDTSKAVEAGEDLASSEIINSSAEEEAALEPDAFVDQENISYDGTNSKQGLDLLGPYQGIMYFNQGDSRWGSKLYTSTGNKSQTIKSSGCGPTSAAMVVSSSKGLILPPTMCELFVDNGFRTANNGTAWKAFPFVADFFDFDFYDETSNFNEALNYMKTDKDKDGISDYFIVISCGSGLWTTGGHFVVWINQSGNQSAVNDPYLYPGKYNTASRRAANVTVSGNTAYLTSSNLYKYSNAKRYFVFSNDQTGKTSSSNTPKPSSTPSNTTSVNYTRYVSTQSQNLNIRSGPGTGYSIVGSLAKGTKVNVTAVSNGFSKIGTDKWVSSSYLSATKPGSTTSSSTSGSSTSYKTTVGKTYKLKANTTLYSKSNLTGTKYQYLKNTSVKVLSHASSTVDYIYISQTGRYCYCPVSALSGTTSTSSSSTSVKKSTVGEYKTLKQNCTLYSKSNLTGTKYQYLKGTKVKIVKNVSSTVDQIYVVKTGRYAYVSTKNYK